MTDRPEELQLATKVIDDFLKEDRVRVEDLPIGTVLPVKHAISPYAQLNCFQAAELRYMLLQILYRSKGSQDRYEIQQRVIQTITFVHGCHTVNTLATLTTAVEEIARKVADLHGIPTWQKTSASDPIDASLSGGGVARGKDDSE